MKLLVVLGLLWILEGTHALFTYFDPRKDEEGAFSLYFFKIVDTLNLLRGGFIFFIFVCKRKVWESINSYRCMKKNKINDVLGFKLTTILIIKGTEAKH